MCTPMDVEVSLSAERHRTEITPINLFRFSYTDVGFAHLNQLLVNAQMQAQIRVLKFPNAYKTSLETTKSHFTWAKDLSQR